ncbi:MAG: GNAT family N-acetyltransferase [Bacteroidia bacterium]
MSSIIPLVQLLNPELDANILEERLQDMITKGYLCMGVYDSEKLIGVCGMWILNKFYSGLHLEPDNVVVLAEYRNKGAGELLMKAVYQYAHQHNCKYCELNCYINNPLAQKYWTKQGFKPLGIHMRKELN